ncbi:MAG: dTDP-glucose 4,6-dehydratase [Marmoricola sp.]
MKLLVTGGAGFIGSHYVRTVLSGAWGETEPEQVLVLDKLTYAGNRANLAPVADDARLEVVEGDILDRVLVDDLIARVDAVVHFAAETHVDRSIRRAHEFVVTNVVGTQTLLDSARTVGVERFVHVSTDEVYGSIAIGSWDEGQPLLPNSPYSASKASGDLLARAYQQTYGVPVCITRCSNNYGPYQYPEKIIPLFVTNLIDGKPVPLYGAGANVRDWLHVDDHCRAVHLVLTGGRDGEIYNIGGGTELTNEQLTGLLLEATGSTWDSVENVEDRPGHDLRYSVDTSKISAELGYRPEVRFSEGLADTVDWYRENRDWWEPLTGTARG